MCLLRQGPKFGGPCLDPVLRFLPGVAGLSGSLALALSRLQLHLQLPDRIYADFILLIATNSDVTLNKFISLFTKTTE